MPPRLFTDAPWIVTPEAGRTKPRLWVRRLVIFRKQNDIVREVQLKPGLNIVWSPDGSEGEPMGMVVERRLFADSCGTAWERTVSPRKDSVVR